MIGSIESLRGIYILLIFLVHYHIDGEPVLVSGGDCGVAFFFMTSGFVMSAGYYKKMTENPVSPLRFSINRCRIFYPLHLVCIAAAIILYRISLTPQSIEYGFLNIGLLESWISNPECYFGYNPVAWFLSDIAFCYIIFAITANCKLFSNLKSKETLIFALSVIAYLILIRFIRDSREKINFYCYILPITRSFDFILGILVWQIYDRTKRAQHSKEIERKLLGQSMFTKTLIETAAIASVVLSIVLYPYIRLCYQAAAMWWPSTIAVLLIFSIFDNKKGGLISRMLATKPLRGFGRISFVFFIIHILNINFVRILDNHFNLGFGDMPRFIITLLLTTALAAIIHNYFQKPYRQWLKNNSQNR